MHCRPRSNKWNLCGPFRDVFDSFKLSSLAVVSVSAPHGLLQGFSTKCTVGVWRLSPSAMNCKHVRFSHRLGPLHTIRLKVVQVFIRSFLMPEVYAWEKWGRTTISSVEMTSALLEGFTLLYATARAPVHSSAHFIIAEHFLELLACKSCFFWPGSLRHVSPKFIKLGGPR